MMFSIVLKYYYYRESFNRCNPTFSISKYRYTYLLYTRFGIRKNYIFFFDKFNLSTTYLNTSIDMDKITKMKISKTMKGRKMNATHKKHISQSLRNRKLTNEHKENISKSMKLKNMKNK